MITRTKKTMITNILYSGIYQVLILIVPLLTTPYITRIFTIDQMGEYGASLALANLLSFASKMGMGLYGNRAVAQASEQENLSATFFKLFKVQVIGSVIFFILFIASYGNTTSDYKMTMIQSLLILFSFLDVSWFFIGLEEIKKVVVKNTFAKIISTLSIFLFVKKTDDIYIYVWIVVLGIIIGNLTMWFNIKKYINFNFVKTKTDLKDVKGSTALMVPHFLNNMYLTIDRQYLLFFTDSISSVGIYDQGRKIINIITTFCNASMDALIPRLSYMADKEIEYLKYVNKGIELCKYISILLVIGIMSSTKYFVPLFFGPGYESVTIVMEISALTFIILPTSLFLSNGIIISKGKDKSYFYTTVIMVIVSFLCNLILDSKYMFIGASSAFVITEIVGFIFKVYSVRNIVNSKNVLFNILYISGYSFIFIFIIEHVNRLLSIENNLLNFFINGILSLLLISGIITFKLYKKKNRSNLR